MNAAPLGGPMIPRGVFMTRSTILRGKETMAFDSNSLCLQDIPRATSASVCGLFREDRSLKVPKCRSRIGLRVWRWMDILDVDVLKR
jgi:hypothetical protein